jgi:hypothetical protein
MKTIKLLCVTRGLQFGDTIDVGEGKNKISEADALELIKENLAEEVKPLVDGSKEKLAKDLAVAEDKTKELEAKLAVAEDKIKELEAKLVAKK